MLLHHAKSALIRVYRYAYDLLHLGALFDVVFRAIMSLVELNVVPDCIIRNGMRLLLRIRLFSMAGTLEQQLERKLAFVRELKVLPVAVQTAAANEQHYEVPTEYFLLVLGRHLKYSCCLFNSPNDTLEEAERSMLALYCARARLHNGQSVLELGCGWGSLSLFMAQAYPNSTVTAVSNSNTQREYIMQRARDLDLTNLQVITADMNDFQVCCMVAGRGGTDSCTVVCTFLVVLAGCTETSSTSCANLVRQSELCRVRQFYCMDVCFNNVQHLFTA
eukprot:GHRR01024257.1.p1 GENE.GHRR01024257.1~~GHRR01024257.1.p1  ORF type:complete len:276 (+),score=65.87 GHRR01024257.1:212-1039(+)